MKTYLFLLLFVFQAFSLSSQISLKGYNQEKIDPSLFEGRWKARWISYPGEAPNVYGVYHFRKSFDLEVVPSRFIVHVSADNRSFFDCNDQFCLTGFFDRFIAHNHCFDRRRYRRSIQARLFILAFHRCMFDKPIGNHLNMSEAVLAEIPSRLHWSMFAPYLWNGKIAE